jgi:glycosyltransferase involved in cell wall biosynthesis
VELPSITVVTPCLNAAGTIEQALDSVRTQDYQGPLQHVVVDGGSTDGTGELLAARSDIEWTSEPDRGLSHAMNKGLERARGELIGWLNADDFYLPGALEAAGQALADHPDALWLTGHCPIVDSAGHEIRRPVSAYKRALLRHYSYGLYLTQNFVSCPATFVHRRAVDQVGGLDERFRISMDYDWFLRIGRLSDPVVLDRPLAVFRMAGESLSMTGFERQFAEHALNAREHGAGHPLAVTTNRLMSRAIVAIYRVMRVARRPTAGYPRS